MSNTISSPGNNGFSESDYNRFYHVCNEARKFHKEIERKKIEYSVRTIASPPPDPNLGVLDSKADFLAFVGDKSGQLYRFDLDEIVNNKSHERCTDKFVTLPDKVSALEIIKLESCPGSLLKFIAVGSDDSILRIYSANETSKPNGAPLLFEQKLDSPIKLVWQPDEGSPLLVSTNSGALYIVDVSWDQEESNLKSRTDDLCKIPSEYISTVCRVKGEWLWFGTHFGKIWTVHVPGEKDYQTLRVALTDKTKRLKPDWSGERIRRLFCLSIYMEGSSENHHRMLCLSGSRLICLGAEISEDKTKVVLEAAEGNVNTEFMDVDVNFFPVFDGKIYATGITYDANLFWVLLKPDSTTLEGVFCRRKLFEPLGALSSSIKLLPVKESDGTDEKKGAKIGSYMVLGTGDQAVGFYAIKDKKVGSKKVEEVFDDLIKNHPNKISYIRGLGYIARRYHGRGHSEKLVQRAILRLISYHIKRENILFDNQIQASEFQRCIGWLLSGSDLNSHKIIADHLIRLIKEFDSKISDIGKDYIYRILLHIQKYLVCGDSFFRKKSRLLELIKINKSLEKRFDAMLYTSFLYERGYDLEWDMDLRGHPIKYTLEIISFESISILTKGKSNTKKLFICATSDARIHLFTENGDSKTVWSSEYNRIEIEKAKEEEKQGSLDVEATLQNIVQIVQCEDNILFFYSNAKVLVVKTGQIDNWINNEESNENATLNDIAEKSNKKPANASDLKLPKSGNNPLCKLACVIAYDGNGFIVGTEHGVIYWFRNIRAIGVEIWKNPKGAGRGAKINAMAISGDLGSHHLLLVGLNSGYVYLIKFIVSEEAIWISEPLFDFLYDIKGIQNVFLSDNGSLMIISSKGRTIHGYKIDLKCINTNFRVTHFINKISLLA